MSFTPGPWIANDFGRSDLHKVNVCTCDGEADYYLRMASICECYVDDDPKSHPQIGLTQAESNAQLIACAPDLLAVLVAAESTIVDLLGAAGRDAKFKHNVLPQIRAVIAKATGGAA